MQVRSQMPCQKEPAFGEMWALVHSEALLEDRLKALTHQISDANLKQMPEFHQRVDILRQLEYVSPENIVQMKVRPFPHFNSSMGRGAPCVRTSKLIAFNYPPRNGMPKIRIRLGVGNVLRFLSKETSSEKAFSSMSSITFVNP